MAWTPLGDLSRADRAGAGVKRTIIPRLPRRYTVTVHKIVYALGLLLAIVAAFMNVPYAATLLGVLGAIAAFAIIADHHVRVIVSALVLHAAAAMMIVLRNMYNRLVN